MSFLVNILVELGDLNTVLAVRYDGRGALLHDTTADVVAVVACIHQAFLLGLDKFFDQKLSLDAVVPLRPCEYEVQGVSQAMRILVDRSRPAYRLLEVGLFDTRCVLMDTYARAVDHEVFFVASSSMTQPMS